ncbi:MAG: TonB-dependent receptor plug domain-containing protein, partial [Candidatus Marinimicrobia bacterium]|nr:TonB-dependent receptor plug domain-containing protein [Candidatus Neomarinimicrobiota bacterium]
MKLQFCSSKSVVILLAIILSNSIFAGKISGTVKQEGTVNPVQFATVTLIRSADRGIEMGQMTDNDGYFELLNVPAGDEFRIEVKFIGFDSYWTKPFSIDSDENQFIDFGDIFIKQGVLEGDLIEVNADRPLYEVTVDKKVYVIDQMKTTSGGTCCDVMKKVPSLDLGPNGEISFRGSENVAVLVNGKRAGILGDERKSCAVAIPIPAAMIDRVEIITSPSAEYDPDGMTGIVNIILKEDKVSGYNGDLSINIGSTNKLNLGSTLSYRNNKLHLFSKFSTEMLEQRGNGY